jgi:hypothetical protein
MSPDTDELVGRAEVVRAEGAELCGIMEQRLRIMRQLCKDLKKNRSAAAKVYIARPGKAEQDRPDS